MAHTENPKPDFVIRITAKEDKGGSFSSYHTFHVYAQIFTRNPAKPYSADSICGTNDYPENPAHFYNGLTVEVCTFADSRDGASINTETYYQEPYRVNSTRANQMHKTLTRIDKAMTKLQNAEGWAQSYGQTINRLARIIGATYIMTPNSPQSVDVTGEKYRWNSIGDAVGQIDNLTWQWLRGLEKEKELSNG